MCSPSLIPIRAVIATANSRKVYRAFVQDLHARLASGRYGTIRFTAGWTQSRYLTMLVVAFMGAAASLIAGIAFYLMLGVIEVSPS